MKDLQKGFLETAVFVVIVIAIAVFFVYGMSAVSKHEEINQKSIPTACLDNLGQIESATMTFYAAYRCIPDKHRGTYARVYEREWGFVI